jgi:hypothetical protein
MPEMYLLATRWRPRNRVKRGAIVLVRGFGGPEPNSQALMIKRVGCIAGDTAYVRLHEDSHEHELLVGHDQVFVVSDADPSPHPDVDDFGPLRRPHAIDSRSFGPILVSSIVGVVLAKLGSVPPRRRIPARRVQR